MKRRICLFLRCCVGLVLAVFIASAITACGPKIPQGTNNLNLSQPGTFEFGGTNVTVKFDNGFDETVTGANGSSVERKAIYADGLLAFTAYDTDRDGKDDLWFQYNDELRLTLEMRDTNGDGKPDKIVYYDKDERVIREETR